MKRFYTPPKVTEHGLGAEGDFLYNQAGKEEGVLTTSWEGGMPTDTRDDDDSERARRRGRFLPQIWEEDDELELFEE